jgi:hypothetical protein
MAAEFFQGAPCVNCLRTERYAKDGKCVYCRRLGDRARYSKRRPQQKAYYDANKERICAETRERDRKKHARDPRYKMLSSAKQRAKSADRECTLVLSDVVIPACCPLLGTPIIIGSRRVKNQSPTVDRKDSTKGYTPDNVWVISWRANRIKSNSTLEELKLIVKNWPQL